MTPVPRHVPWLLALLSAFVQAHGATTSGHLMWLAPVPWGAALILACRDLPPRRAAARGAALGALIGFVSSAHLWGIAYYNGAVYLLILAYHTLVWGLFSAWAGVCVVRGGKHHALAAAAGWAFIETVRSLGALSFPFYFGGTLADELPVVQMVSVVGTSGLSGLLFWVGFSLAGPFAAFWRERRWARPGYFLPAIVTAAVAIGGGALRLATSPRAPSTIRVSALQGSIPSWLYSLAIGAGPFRAVVEEQYGFLYREALASKPPPDLILFPETTFDWHILPDTAAVRRLRPFSVTRLPPTTAVMFGASFTNAHALGSANGVGILTPDREGRPVLRSILTKHELVPFIEMVHQPANRWQVARVDGRSIGLMICYESMYPEPALNAAARGARLLTILSDDGGMRRAPIAWTHAEQGRMRAIEVGLPLVRDGQAGISFMTDAYGRVLGRLDPWQTGVLTRDVPLQNVDTIYRHVGAWWALVWALLALTPVVWSKREA